MTNPFVSIIVPVYNGGRYIDTFFTCLDKQSYSDYEVILVDDGSEDDSYEKCLSYARSDGKVKLYRKENGGPGSARNYGIEKASGEYVAFFDIDDEFNPEVFNENLAIATKNDSDIVMWNFTMLFHDNGQKFYRKLGVSTSLDSEEFFRKYLIPTLDNEMFNPPWNKLIKRNLLIENSIRFHTEFSIYEDILFSYEVCKKAQRFSINDKSYYTYIIKNEGSLLTKFHPECFKAILCIYKAAQEYGNGFDNNIRQINRFKEQFIYLTRGFIKQICINTELSFAEKKKALAEIQNNTEYMRVSKEFDKGIRRFPSKFMIRHRLFHCLILYYNILNELQKKH